MSKKLKNIKKTQDKTYLAKDFVSFRNDLTRYAKNYFADTNADFSEASLGGMFVELAAYVGDSMSYFLDYQFNELRPDTATEQRNILAHARNAGVKIYGASPASTMLSVFIEVPASLDTANNLGYIPDVSSLPVILEGTEAISNSGIVFTTTEDLDFNDRDPENRLLGKITTSQVNSAGNPSSFIIERFVPAVSGQIFVENITLGASVPFRKITLAQTNISEVMSVIDTDENSYYEVDFLTQDTAFKKTKNLSDDKMEVPSTLEVVSAARRFTTETNFNSGLTTLMFGGGDESLPDDDAIPDPSSLALPLYGRKTFSKFSIDPNMLLRTQTLGIAPANTTLTITYRAGGGQNHNIEAGAITEKGNINVRFPRSTAAITDATVINSLDIINRNRATGGLPRQSIDDVRAAIAQSRNQQSRIVTQDDLLARVYSLPTPFGRVFRASVRKSARNPLASELFVISKDISGRLVPASDTLKKNLSVYLNEFRLISDAIDVLDVQVINYGIEYSVVTTPEANKAAVVSAIDAEIGRVIDLNNFQIDQPIIEADFINAIINTPGVLAMNSLLLYNKSGLISERQYSPVVYDMTANKFKGMIVGPPGSIFEVKYGSVDILGSAE